VPNVVLANLPVATGGIDPFSLNPIRATAFQRVRSANDQMSRARTLNSASIEERRLALVDLLDKLQQEASRKSAQDNLMFLNAVGMAWRDVARILNVSVAAIQKWRRGEGVQGDNRLKISKIVALIKFLEENFVTDPASWLEMPVKDGVMLTRIDLLAAGRYDLVLELGEFEQSAPADSVLDEFDPTWRITRVDNNFEVFTASDGVPSIRPRGGV